MHRLRALPPVLLALALSGCSDDVPRALPAQTPPAATSPTQASAAAPRAAAPPAGSAPVAVTASPSAESRVRLTGDGVDLRSELVEFGTDVDAASAALSAALGPPTTDTGVVRTFSAYTVCPATQRALAFGGGALVVLFGDVEPARLTMYSWRLTGRGSAVGLPRASVLRDDGTTGELAVGTTLQALRSGAGPGAVEVSPADESSPASFRLLGPSSGLYGTLSGTGPRDTVTLVQAGLPCGE